MPGAVVETSAGVAGRPVGPIAGRRHVPPDRSGIDAGAERPRPVSRGGRDDVQELPGEWRGAVLAVSRLCVLRAKACPLRSRRPEEAVENDHTLTRPYSESRAPTRLTCPFRIEFSPIPITAGGSSPVRVGYACRFNHSIALTARRSRRRSHTTSLIAALRHYFPA